VKQNQHIIQSLIAPLVALSVASTTQAATTTYDMSRLLYEPHPFANVGGHTPPPVIRLQGSGAGTSIAPVATPGVVNRVQATPPVRGTQAPGAATIPGSLPPPIAIPMPTSIPASKSPHRSSIVRAPAKKPVAQLSQVGFRSDDPSYLTLGVGYFDINDNQDAVEFRAEWRFKKLFWKIHPFVGLMGTTDKAVYGYGGIALDWKLGKFVLTPSFAAGAYTDGDGKDLGHTIEFRSALEVAYQFENRHRLGLIFYHLSNASIGDTNPGTEVLSLGYSIPFD